MTAEQFWSQVDKNGPFAPRLKSQCWTWTGYRLADNAWSMPYGHVRWGGRTRNAHRVAWELTHGTTVPADLVAAHACDNPSCVNPAHVWIGTKQHNAIDRVLKGRMIVKQVA